MVLAEQNLILGTNSGLVVEHINPKDRNLLHANTNYNACDTKAYAGSQDQGERKNTT